MSDAQINAPAVRRLHRLSTPMYRPLRALAAPSMLWPTASLLATAVRINHGHSVAQRGDALEMQPIARPVNAFAHLLELLTERGIRCCDPVAVRLLW